MLRLEMALMVELSASGPPQQLNNSATLISVEIEDVEKMMIFWSFLPATGKVRPSPLSGMQLRGGYRTRSSD
jgi:hypothetical protein